MFRGSMCSVLAKECKKLQDVLLKRCESSLSSNAAGAPCKYDVVIVGAGCMGSLVAFWLKKKAAALSILVIDRDLTVNKSPIFIIVSLSYQNSHYYGSSLSPIFL